MKRSTLWYLVGELLICAIPLLVLLPTLTPDDRLAFVLALGLAMFGPLLLGLITLGAFRK